jgi:hypothetical protein
VWCAAQLLTCSLHVCLAAVAAQACASGEAAGARST